MIFIRNLCVAFGDQVLFEDASLVLNHGDRYALVGPNGAGKSTLFRLILKEMEPDSGDVDLRKGIAVGYLPQENPPVSDETVLTEAVAGLPHPDARDEAKAKTILDGLGFRQTDFTRPVKELSGGWAMRVALARLLVEEPELLLLDEPTNHLDLWSLLWFREYLQHYRGTIFVISHDRDFINTVCTAMVSVQNQGLKIYKGSYETYEAERIKERQLLEKQHRTQQSEMEKMQEFIDRNRARLSTAKRAQSMMRRLERVERIELPQDPKGIAVQLPQPVRSGRDVLTLKDLHKSYGTVPVYKGLNLTLQRGWRCALVGPNGAGKSTLLKILAGVLPFERGERIEGANVNVGYLSQHRMMSLHPELTVFQEADANDRNHSTSFTRTVLGSFLFGGDAADKKVQVLSGGEKTRLAMVKILLDPPNLLLLDEPTTHLDMNSVAALIEALKRYEGTLAFISHDIHFINALANQVIHVDRGQVRVYPGQFDLYMWRTEREKAKA